MNTHLKNWQKLLTSGLTAMLLILSFVTQMAMAHGGGSPPPNQPDPDRPHPHGWELQDTVNLKAHPECRSQDDELGKRNDWLQITELSEDSLQCKFGGCNPAPEYWLRHPRTNDNDPATQDTQRHYFSSVDELDKWVNDQRRAYENGMTARVITPKGHNHGSCLVLKLGKRIAVVVIDDAKGAAKVVETAAADLKATAEAGATLVLDKANATEHLVAVHAKAAVKKVDGCVNTMLSKLKNALKH